MVNIMLNKRNPQLFINSEKLCLFLQRNTEHSLLNPLKVSPLRHCKPKYFCTTLHSKCCTVCENRPQGSNRHHQIPLYESRLELCFLAYR